MADEENGKAAVYVSWTTFNNTLNALSKVMPNRLDKSTFTGQSGGVQNQLMAAYKFLGLISDDGTPQPPLEDLAVADEDARKEQLKRVLKQRYAALFGLNLEKMTSDQLNDAMASHYNVTGDTRDKAIRFFLAAVKHAGLPISPYLEKVSGTSNGARKRRAARKAENGGQTGGGADADTPRTPAPPGGSTRMVSLKGRSGTVTLTVAADLLSLTTDDQEFIFALKRSLDEYEAKASS